MTRRVLVLAGVLSHILAAAGCAKKPSAADPRADVDRVLGVLGVPPEDDARREDYARVVVEAERIVAEFARAHGWEAHVQEAFFDRVEVFSTQERLWAWLKREAKLPADQPPPTDGLMAALEFRVLAAVRPEEAARVRPEYAGDGEWTRLLAHEIVHRLQVRLLGGREEAMGPPWFFEGFAVIGSGQRAGEPLEYATVEEALGAGTEGGRGAYRRYGAAVRFWMKRAPLSELVEKAGLPGFEVWLRSLPPREE